MPVMRYLEALKSLRELDPVRALRTWLTMAGIDSGRSSGTSTGGATSAPVRCQVLRRLRSSRKPPRRVAWTGEAYSAHSLRAGFVSECDRRHVPSAAVRTVTGHQTDAMLNSYSRPGQLFADSAGAYFEGV